MMNMYYKWKGKNALRGNWQTAMVVAFFSGIFVGVLSALITTVLGAQFHDPLLFGLFVVLLLIRPYGIFSSRKKVASSI